MSLSQHFTQSLLGFFSIYSIPYEETMGLSIIIIRNWHRELGVRSIEEKIQYNSFNMNRKWNTMSSRLWHEYFIMLICILFSHMMIILNNVWEYMCKNLVVFLSAWHIEYLCALSTNPNTRYRSFRRKSYYERLLFMNYQFTIPNKTSQVQ